MDTLRALEAAARLQSYSAAAREMNLTHGAISHRLRALEADLGITLFERHGNSMHPTAEGRRLAEQSRQALAVLSSAFSGLRAKESLNHSRQRLVISVVPALATHFLADRLPSFNAAHPQIELDLRPNPEVISLQGGETDLAIRYGKGLWANTEGFELPPHQLVAVASPRYVKSKGLDADAASMKRALEDAAFLTHRWRSWLPWFQKNGLKAPGSHGGQEFEESTLMLRAAVRDGGLALCAEPYVRDLVDAGELVKLPLDPIIDPNRFHLLWASSRQPEGTSELFQWLDDILREVA